MCLPQLSLSFNSVEASQSTLSWGQSKQQPWENWIVEDYCWKADFIGEDANI